MAAAVKGMTLHSSAALQRPNNSGDTKLTHQEIDHLVIQNADLRWILVDEVSMISDELLGAFEDKFKSAAKKNAYATRQDGSPRFFGGYNILFFGD